MPCPKCDKPKSEEHRDCVFDLLKEKTIASYSDWLKLWEVPETKKLGKIKVKIPKPKPESSS